jgi:hypothetical protein
VAALEKYLRLEGCDVTCTPRRPHRVEHRARPHGLRALPDDSWPRRKDSRSSIAIPTTSPGVFARRDDCSRTTAPTSFRPTAAPASATPYWRERSPAPGSPPPRDGGVPRTTGEARTLPPPAPPRGSPPAARLGSSPRCFHEEMTFCGTSESTSARSRSSQRHRSLTSIEIPPSDGSAGGSSASLGGKTRVEQGVLVSGAGPRAVPKDFLWVLVGEGPERGASKPRSSGGSSLARASWAA